MFQRRSKFSNEISSGGSIFHKKNWVPGGTNLGGSIFAVTHPPITPTHYNRGLMLTSSHCIRRHLTSCKGFLPRGQFHLLLYHASVVCRGTPLSTCMVDVKAGRPRPLACPQRPHLRPWAGTGQSYGGETPPGQEKPPAFSAKHDPLSYFNHAPMQCRYRIYSF